MPLDACIAKVGTLSENDIAFLRQEIADGKTDEQAIANLEVLVEQEANTLVARIEAAGGQVQREAPPIDMVTAADAASLENNIKLAESTKYDNNRQLKEAMQANVLQEGIDLTERTEENAAHLAAVGTADAIFALQDNADAVGWYDRTVSKALEILGEIHPEILTDPDARFAFTYALAVTSNGMKVDNNFKMAEKAYRTYKDSKDGKMPNDIGEGTAASAINEHMDLFNELVEEFGIENLAQVFNSRFTVSQLKMLDLDPGGELVETEVYGAAVLGPKIGNGFFMNLNGEFDQLTMDRWLMRTWGRWTGSLIVDRPDLIEEKTEKMHKLLTRFAKAKKSWEFFQKTIDMDLNNHGQPGGPTHAEIARKIQKVSVNKDSRSDMNRTVTGDKLRKLGNGLAKDIDGQKEAPQHGTERVWIRKVFATILDNMHAQGYTDMTMADLQALLWYPEKRLYDKAKSSEDVANGYDLDEAPDYANAAAGLAAKQGIKPAVIKAAIERAEQQHESQVSARRAAGELQPQAAEGQAPGGRGLARKERGTFLRRNILVPNRVSRGSDAKAKSYTAPSRGTLGTVRGIKHTPRQDYSKELAAAEVTPMTMVEMEPTTESAILFAQSIQNIKDAHPEGAAVYVYPLESNAEETGYEDMKLFVNEDQTAGFAVKADGDIVSVFATPDRDQPGRVYSMLALAVERAGGTKLDAFDTVLPTIYGMAGFVETGRDQWNEDYRPPDWDKTTFAEYNNGEPDIVYMEYKPDHVPKYFAQTGIEKDEAYVEIDDAINGGTIKVTEEEAAKLVEMGYTHPDERLTQADRVAQTADGSEQDRASSRELYAAATGRDQQAASAEFARARSGHPVSFINRSQNEKKAFTDSRLGGNTGTPSAYLGHFLSALDTENPDYGSNVNVVEFQMHKPLVISMEDFYDMGPMTIEEFKKMRADLMAIGHDGILIEGIEQAIVFEGQPLKIHHDTSGQDWLAAEVEKEEFLGQDKEGDDRARFYPDVGGKRVIQLLETSDLSSFLHESGHLFLDIQRIWADKYGMNENQQAMLDWLGIDNFENITDEQHETWAETFEVYLREGKAPSVGLRRAFASFASWLKRIYRTLSNERLQRARLDPEITEIFDRMLATQSEIDIVKLQPEYAELFQSQEQAGMTDAQWAKYKKNATKKNETAEATIDARVMKEYKHQKSAEWAAEKAPLIAAQAERLAKEPVYQVLSDMSVIKDENGEIVADGRVDWHALRDAIGEWPNGKNWIGKAVGGGLDPALYADAHGFASVQDMYDQVKNSDTLKQASDKAAEQIMVQKYGDILNDGSLEQEVREAMLNEEQAAMVLAELKAEGRPAAQRIDRGTLKYEAEKLIGTYTYKQIRPTKFYNAMIKAAQRAAKAEDPTNDKIQQLANHYLYKAATDAKLKMEKAQKKVRGVQTRKYNPLQVDEAYIGAMKNLAMAYDMRKTPLERDAYARRVLDFYEGQTKPFNKETGEGNENAELFGLEMLDPNLVAAIRYRHDNGTLEGFELTTFEEMTVSEMRGVTEMLDHLRYVGGQVANKGAAEAAAIREAGLESIEENGGNDSKVQRGKTRKGKMAKLTWGDMVNSIPSLGNMIRKLDGFKDGGWAFENIYKPINEAMARKYELQMAMYKDMEAWMANMSRVGLRENDAMPFTKEDGTTDDFTSSEVFMMAVYWGTDSSRQALMQGHELTEADVQQLMARLTPQQLTLVNNVWAMNESQWPQLQEAAKAMLGIAPPKLEATPFVVNGVEMTGGHMQLMYDSQALELADEQQRGMNTANVVPMQAGSTHARVGSGGRPVLLDTRNITQSVEEKTHYIAFATVGRHLRGILNNKEIQNKIEKKHGAPFYENMLHAITSISRAEPARETSRWLARLSRHMRGAATMMHLAYSIRNVAQQFSAIPIAAREVGVLKWTQAMGHFGSRPLEVMEMVDAKSKFMENRKQVVNREAKEYMKKVMATSRGEAMWNNVKARGFILQTIVDSTVAYPTWYAKYQTGMENHGDEARAVLEADQSVAESVGSGSDMHLGRIMQSNQNEFVKTLTVFGSWFNAYYQRLYKSSKGGTNFLSAAFLMDGILMPIIAANLAQVLIMDFPDEDEEVEEYIAKNSFKFLLGTMPLIRDIASAWEGFAPTMPISAVAVAPVRIKTEIESFMKGNQSGWKLTADIGRAAGSVIPMPGSGNLWRFLDYTDSFLDGKEGKNFNIYQALAEGRDKDK